MLKLITAAVLALSLLTACGDKPDAAACEAAIRAGASKAFAGETQSKPAECDGLSDAELEEIGTRVLEDVMSGE